VTLRTIDPSPTRVANSDVAEWIVMHVATGNAMSIQVIECWSVSAWAADDRPGVSLRTKGVVATSAILVRTFCLGACSSCSVSNSVFIPSRCGKPSLFNRSYCYTVTWPFDSHYVISYRGSTDTDPLSWTVFEILSYKRILVATLTFQGHVRSPRFMINKLTTKSYLYWHNY